MMGADPEQIVVGNNSSLALMHDTIVYALLKGTCDSGHSLVKTRGDCIPVPGTWL